MVNSNRFAALAALLGGLAVILGAFGAHALGDKVSAKDLDIWKTGAHYHLVHSVALLALCLWDREGKFRMVAWLWLVGILIFAGSLYALVLSQVRVLGAITPIGGLCLIIGWLILAVKLFRAGAEPG
ncbi:MAG: DUF423 domain-containing protein [Armatimonadetes bacterium]|nr:DUF423 domain-containing protein [Armatimonadota bacterium]MBS1728248.1 DUF423 domain-containing protein [Armatimonadota bacterium]